MLRIRLLKRNKHIFLYIVCKQLINTSAVSISLITISQLLLIEQRNPTKIHYSTVYNGCTDLNAFK